MKPIDEAQREEEIAKRLVVGGSVFDAVVHFVNAKRLYCAAAMQTGNPDVWEAAERCARAAAETLDRVADFCSENRQEALDALARRPH